MSTLLIGYATGKQIQTRTRTNGATVDPIAKPYREQTDCGIICTSKVNRYLIIKFTPEIWHQLKNVN